MQHDPAVVASRVGGSAWLNLSVCYDAFGRHEDARQAFARSFALDREGTIESVRAFLSDGKQDAAQSLLGHLAAMRAE
jgi:Flp pilus assembly protein TadD